MSPIYSILEYMPDGMKQVLISIDTEILSRINEIRVRRNKELVIVIRNSTYFINKNGFVTDYCDKNSWIINSSDFDNLFMKLCDYSIHSNTQNLKKGFLTLKNGSRVGVASTAVYDNDGFSFVKNVIALNIRVPQQAIDCSTKLLNSIYNSGELPSVIVAGKPNSGKTTLLRDIARQLSSGFNDEYRKVAIIDERNEFCGKFESEITLDVGINTDVLTYFTKSTGIELATRTLSPEIIICDEVSTEQELSSIMYAFSSGISFALSVHISDQEDLLYKPIIKKLLMTNQFDYIVLLDNYTYIPKIVKADDVLNEIHRNDFDNSVYNSNWLYNC